jgi:hypothetical protein
MRKMKYNNNNNHHPIRLRTSTTFPPEFTTGVEVDIHQNDWDTMDNRHSQLWRIHHSIAELTPSSTQLEQLDHSANPPWLEPLDPHRVSVHIPQQKKDETAKTHINLTNTLVNNPEHLLIYTDGSQTKGASCGTGLIAIHAHHPHSEALWNLGPHTLNNPTTNRPQIFAAPSSIPSPTPIKFPGPALFFCNFYCNSCGCCGSFTPLPHPCQG